MRLHHKEDRWLGASMFVCHISREILFHKAFLMQCRRPTLAGSLFHRTSGFFSRPCRAYANWKRSWFKCCRRSCFELKINGYYFVLSFLLHVSWNVSSHPPLASILSTKPPRRKLRAQMRVHVRFPRLPGSVPNLQSPHLGLARTRWPYQKFNVSPIRGR